jgi:hypothetical protein
MSEHAVNTIVAGVFVGILGVLIKYVGVMELIAGYDPETVTDEEGLADRDTSAYPRLPVSDECSDTLSEPRSEQAEVERTAQCDNPPF